MPVQRTVAIAELKAHLSSEIKKARSGETIIIMDHKQAVACLCGLEADIRYTQKAQGIFDWPALEPLGRKNLDIDALLAAERAD